MAGFALNRLAGWISRGASTSFPQAVKDTSRKRGESFNLKTGVAPAQEAIPPTRDESIVVSANFFQACPSLRLFVALPLPGAVRESLRQFQRELRDAMVESGAVAWTPPRNMHLTLRFLGRVESVRVPALIDALTAALAGLPALDLRCAGAGAFPEPLRARVIWAGVEERRSGLPALASAVDAAVTAFAERPAEREFTPHVTLGRPRRTGRAAAELAKAVARQREREFGAWRGDAVELARSELSPGGSRFTTLARFPLAALRA